MTNEWETFRAYTDQPAYTLINKKTTAFLGRFTSDMLREFTGFWHIFTTLARGVLFHAPDGTPRPGDPYSRTDEARRFLCAWCSVPGGPGKSAVRDDERSDAQSAALWRFGTSFGQYSDEFPTIVTPDGRGWLYRHVHALASLIDANRDKVNKRLHPLADRTDAWDDAWRRKVVHYQVPLFAESTKSDWPLSFDSAVADALELGPLRTEPVTLPDDLLTRLEADRPPRLPADIMPALAAYYLANRQPDSDWVVLPVTNMEAYLGSTALSRQYLAMIPETVLQRKRTSLGVCVYRIVSAEDAGTD